MQVIDEVRVETSASVPSTKIFKFVGPQGKKIHAFLINHGAHGYGKFGIDEMSLKAFETGLHKIENSLDRKQITNIMYDLIKSGKIAGSRVLNLILNNLQHETAVDVLQDTLCIVVPAILEKFLHPEVHEIWSTKMFELTIQIMKSGTFKQFNSAMETLLASAIDFA